MRPFQLLFISLVTILLPLNISAQTAEVIKPDSLPQRWQYVSEFIQQLPTDDRWWQQLSDPTLDSLIALGVQRNFNLLAAMHRIQAARQTVRQAQAGYYPTLTAQAGWTKTRTSGAMTSYGTPSNMDYFSAGIDMQWEIDVFGRVAARRKQAKAQVSASRADYAAVMVSLCSELARNYAALRTAQDRLAVARAHIAEQDSVVIITKARFEAELASKLDVEQASTIYYSTVASVPQLEASIETSIAAIALLVGDFPEQLKARLSVPAPLPDYRQIVGAGLPADLVRRRPDVAQAEAALASSAAAVGIAKKDFLPTLSLQGSIGTSAHRPGDLFSNKSFTYTIAPTISWTIFDGLARNAALQRAKEEMKASVEQYNLSVVTAVQEVDCAMSRYMAALREVELLTSVLEHAESAFHLSLELYRSGLSSFTNVAQAQISYLQYADTLASARGNALTALINLYSALGGGWIES